MDATSFSRGLGFSINSKVNIKQRPVSAYNIPMRSKLHTKTNTLAVENEIKETLSHEEQATVTFRNNDEEDPEESPGTIKNNDFHSSNKDRVTVTAQTNRSEFRISTLVKPKIYKPDPLFERLKQPKGTYQPREPFLEKEFRGLFNADY